MFNTNFLKIEPLLGSNQTCFTLNHRRIRALLIFIFEKIKVFSFLVILMIFASYSYAQKSIKDDCKEKTLQFSQDGKQVNLSGCQAPTVFLTDLQYTALIELLTEIKVTYLNIEAIEFVFADIKTFRKEWKYAFSLFDQDKNTFYVIFDKNEIRKLNLLSFRLVLAHELGHLICEHYKSEYPTKLELSLHERDADFMAGYHIARLPSTRLGGIELTKKNYIDSTLKFLFGKEKISKTPVYPPQIRRRDSFLSGFNYGIKNIIRQRPHRKKIITLLKNTNHDE